MVGVGESIGKAVGAKKQLDEAKKEATRMRSDRERALGMSANQDWEPNYVNEAIAPFQRSQSPVADAFMSSLITGRNPAAVQGVRNGAPQARAAAQQSFDKSYGPVDALLSKQSAMQTATPWGVRTPQKPVVEDSERANMTLGPTGTAALSKYKLKPAEYSTLQSLGFVMDPNKGNLTSPDKLLRDELSYLNDLVKKGDTGAFSRYAQQRAGGNDDPFLARSWDDPAFVKRTGRTPPGGG